MNAITKRLIIYAIACLFLISSVPAFAGTLIKSDVITTDKMKITWGYCPYGMLETSVMKEKKLNTLSKSLALILGHLHMKS